VKLAVLGVGLIGGSIGLAARERIDDIDVVGFDARPDAVTAAHERGAIDRAAPSVAEAVRGADAVFACAPVGALPGLVAEALSQAGDDTVVTDVGSTKRQLAAAADDPRFIGGHPIAGAESAGVDSARADLFEGAAWYLTPSERSGGLLYERLHGLLVQLGAQPVAIDAETHDRVLAAVSHLPHVMANVLVSQAARRLTQDDERLPRVGPSFRDMTRVAGANPGIWTDIYLSNAEAIADEIDAAVHVLNQVSLWLRGEAGEALTGWSETARGDRRRLLEADLAGGPVCELTVTVPNRPGIVAQVALALGRAGVNIADMSLAPAQDMRSGAMTLWIAGQDDADRAAKLIEELGYPVASVPE
jgi:prephenate dehydrogenase